MAYCTKTDLRNQVIYSIYVRNYSEEGTFLEVEKDLDRIKGLGVDIIWFLPIYPIGQEKRKGILGSPYALSLIHIYNPVFQKYDELSTNNRMHALRAFYCHEQKVLNFT